MNTINLYIQPLKNYNILDLIEYILSKKYHLNNITLNIFHDDKILDKMAPIDYELSALIYKTSLPHTYNLIVRDLPHRLVICHEMVHLVQYERGDLSLNFKENLFKWKGEDYDVSVPYDRREWEIEAFNLELKLWKSYKNYCKK